MATKSKAASVHTMLIDSAVPFDHRKRLLMHLCTTDSEESNELLLSFLDGAAKGKSDELCEKKAQELSELLEKLQEGPLRSATFLQLVSGSGSARAQVALQDGTLAVTVVPDVELALSLRCGDAVLLDMQGKALLQRDLVGTHTGEEARLERRIGPTHVEVTLRDHERNIFRAADDLIDQLNAGEVTPGRTLLVCPRRSIAFRAVPNPDGLSHYRYLVKDAPPDVVVERDIGAPPAFIEELADHVRIEMTDPDLSRRYRLRRAVMKLLTGVSGSGKTLCIQAFWRRMYEVAAELTGVARAELPPRVLKFTMAQVLSKWLGESDKQIDRFFDEVDQLADERFTAPDGSQHELPVLAIFEECDGMARARGDEAVYDRIQTTLLQRLDVTSQKMKDRLVIFLFTTNVPQVVDPAFLRRAGGTMEKFGRLNRRAFLAVLHKHLRGLPFADTDGKQVAADLAAWLFSPNGSDKGQVEVTFVGSAQPVVKHRRDFLTGALVDRAVQQAAHEARSKEARGTDRPGLNAASLFKAFDRQVRGIIDQLHKDNVSNYLDLPDGVRVGNLRRIDQPAILPIELERAS